MKKLNRILPLALAAIIGAGTLTACEKKENKPLDKERKEIKVGVCAGPYEDLFKDAIEPALKEKGYKIEYVQFSDYVQPNNALADKEIDVNLFQHSTYLKNFSTEHKLDLVHITEVPTAAMGVFSEKLKSIDDIKDGATVAIPNDDTNLSRALRVLAQTKIITLNPDVDPSVATVKDISENPKNLKFQEVSAEILPTVLDSVDIAVINGNYAIGAGLKLTDAIYNEVLGEGYFNVIAVRTEDKDSQFSKDITSIVHSDEFRKIVEDASKQYSAFGKPSGYND
ncbi:MAG: metal ABC transporter substrate-binding protein [Clostridiales bacterium]|nr:metal ABC transporter substrate-binding protein [Clostridiales bacterium]